MTRGEYDRFTARLRERLAADERVVGLVALGSMSGEPPEPDAWSDHDFFVVTRPGLQEALRADLGWLPDADAIALAFRETAHGLKVLTRAGHLLEFAVFSPDELAVARVNRFRTLLDRGDVEERMRGLRTRTAAEAERQRADAGWLAGQLVTGLLVGAGRYARGERLAGRAAVQAAAARLVELLERTRLVGSAALDSLDPLRRFERADPRLGAELDEALGRPPPEAALRLLRLARRELAPHLPGFPLEAAQAVEERLAPLVTPEGGRAR